MLVALVVLCWLASIGYLLQSVPLSVLTVRILARHTGSAAIVMVEGLARMDLANQSLATRARHHPVLSENAVVRSMSVLLRRCRCR